MVKSINAIIHIKIVPIMTVRRLEKDYRKVKIWYSEKFYMSAMDRL